MTRFQKIYRNEGGAIQGIRYCFQQYKKSSSHNPYLYLVLLIGQIPQLALKLEEKDKMSISYDIKNPHIIMLNKTLDAEEGFMLNRSRPQMAALRFQVRWKIYQPSKKIINVTSKAKYKIKNNSLLIYLDK